MGYSAQKGGRRADTKERSEMKAKAGAKRNGRKCLLGIVWWAIACLLLLLAWQSISTEQYALYGENLDRYRQEMHACEELMEGPYAEYYAYLASEWGKLVGDAERYLTAHRVGAASLMAAAALCVGAGGVCVVKAIRRRAEENTDDSEMGEGQG